MEIYFHKREMTYIYDQPKNFKLKKGPKVGGGDIFELAGCKMFHRKLHKLKRIKELSFTVWESTGLNILKSKIFHQNSQDILACPSSVSERLCDESERECFTDELGCRFCHCAIEYSGMTTLSFQFVLKPLAFRKISGFQKFRVFENFTLNDTRTFPNGMEFFRIGSKIIPKT